MRDGLRGAGGVSYLTGGWSVCVHYCDGSVPCKRAINLLAEGTSEHLGPRVGSFGILFSFFWMDSDVLTQRLSKRNDVYKCDQGKTVVLFINSNFCF